MELLFTVFILLLLGIIVLQWVQLKKKSQLTKKLEEEVNILNRQTNDSSLNSIDVVLNPHLFKNILNSVQSHAYQTYYALDKISNILDYILYESKNRLVTPHEEIDFAKKLIEVNRIKLSPLFELSVKTNVDESCLQYNQKVLIPLISIDLIENAFKHTDFNNPGAYISIVFVFKNDVFSLIVSNTISPQKNFFKEKSGIGNLTFEKRLKTFYHDRYSLERVIDDRIYSAQLKIDLNGYKDKVYNS